jgi:hypothetical protein
MIHWLGRQDSNLGNGGIKISWLTISKRILEKHSKHALAISIAWQLFPNEKQPLRQERVRGQPP